MQVRQSDGKKESEQKDGGSKQNGSTHLRAFQFVAGEEFASRMSGHRILIRDSPVAFVPVAVLVQSHVPRPLVFEAELLFDLCDYANLLEELDDILLLHLHRDGERTRSLPVRCAAVRSAKGIPTFMHFQGAAERDAHPTRCQSRRPGCCRTPFRGSHHRRTGRTEEKESSDQTGSWPG